MKDYFDYLVEQYGMQKALKLTGKQPIWDKKTNKALKDYKSDRIYAFGHNRQLVKS